MSYKCSFQPTYLNELGMIHMIKTNIHTPKFILITSHHIILQHGGFKLIAICMLLILSGALKINVRGYPNPKP